MKRIITKSQENNGWVSFHLFDTDGNLLHTEPVCTVPVDDSFPGHRWFADWLDGTKFGEDDQTNITYEIRLEFYCYEAGYVEEIKSFDSFAKAFILALQIERWMQEEKKSDEYKKFVDQHIYSGSISEFIGLFKVESTKIR